MKYFYSADLKRFSQQTADAICAVLRMQVTIVDQDVKKVAGTGCFSHNVLETLPPNYVFTRVISSREVCLIENPGSSIYCANCAEREECKEKATLMVPVVLEGQVIGGIGLAAMTEADKERLLANSEDLTNFMVKMADLLAAKVKSELAIRDTLVLTKNLEAMADSFTDGIICIDHENIVTHFNRHGELLLKLEQQNLVGKDYRNVLYCHLFVDALKTPMNVENIRTMMAVNGVEIPLLASVRSIVHENQISGIVVFFQEIGNTKKKYEQVVMSNARYTFESIRGESQQIRNCIEMAQRISISNSSVLILGESGTGKELFAKAIHNASHRRHNNFVAINCSAIPDNLLESELFGYAPGAFTGAKKDGHMGKFEVANGGTIFLDEIGDMPLNLQVKMLRVLQERIVERIGSSVSVPIDVRVIAATHQDLEQMVKDGLFRQDLYYRINVIPIKIPPLREREGDISIISESLLMKYALLLGKNIEGIDESVMEMLHRYSWPGNIRELENVIEYAINMELGRAIGRSSLPPYLLEALSDQSEKAAEAEIQKEEEERLAQEILPEEDLAFHFSPEPTHVSLKEIYNDSKRQKIISALSQFENTTVGKQQCAKYLGISLSTLYRKMKELGIE